MIGDDIERLEKEGDRKGGFLAWLAEPVTLSLPRSALLSIWLVWLLAITAANLSVYLCLG